MEFITHQHRFGLNVVESNYELKILWQEIEDSLTNITDDMLIQEFENGTNLMSISNAINNLIDKSLTAKDWIPQSAIFQGDEYSDKRWRLDFSKRVAHSNQDISLQTIL